MQIWPRHVARYTFLILAIVFLGWYSYSYIERVVYQAYENWLFDRRMRAAVPARDEKPTGRKLPVFSRSPARIEPSNIVGRISIPSLHLTAMVREGIDEDTLQRAVGHIPATALPGQDGNVGVAGHRDTFFRSLKDLRHNDRIYFSTLHGDYEYTVDQLIVVEPQNAAVLQPTPANTLTLVTCFPFEYIGNAPKRFIVRARQMGGRPIAQWRPTP